MSDLSGQETMLLAFVSSLGRAGINIVDRYQIGLRRLSILNLNLWNNVVPAVAMYCAMALFFNAGSELIHMVFDWRTAAFSGLAQLVAYSFSYAFRNLSVNQVTVAGKFADVFIPLGIFWATNHWSWGTYAFAVATTFVCLPMLWLSGPNRKGGKLLASGGVICVALTLQASLSPTLFGATSTSSASATLVFATAVMMWRALWSLVPILVTRPASGDAPSVRLLLNPLFFVRALLTVTTQVTFIFAVGSPASAIAWPILNATGIISMVLSALFLRERGARSEYVVVCALGAITLLRFLTLS
ncbi:hypothetical protein [Verminephrobacter aporrectodeae]|nr:hypothetical protein [Verminephrobacter aporrectodeae]